VYGLCVAEVTLNGVREKVARAEAHFEELRTAAQAFIESEEHPISLSIPYQVADSDYWSCKALVHKPPPLRLGVILGDLVHNLRSALDHLVWQLVLANGAEPVRGNPGNQWPIVLRAENWERTAQTRLAGVDDAHQATIRTAQPFNLGDRAGDTFPALLMRLSNTDKHQVVHPALAMIHDPGKDAVRFWVAAGPGTIEGNPQVRHGTAFDHGVDLLRVRVAGWTDETHIDMDGDVLAGVAFGEPRVPIERVAEVAAWVKVVVRDIGATLP
jgi:hypothetical protein